MKKSTCAAAVVLVLAVAPRAHAAQFTGDLEVSWRSIRDESGAFFDRLIFGGADTDGDGVLDSEERAIGDIFRSAALGAVLVGATCGLLGAFVTLRRMALFGDMLGHAVLPGVVIGFAIAGEKSTPALLSGALGTGLLAALTTGAIRRFTRIKEDAALGISLSLYYALGTWLLVWVTNHPRLSAEATGLDRYLFGNPAVIAGADLAFLGGAGLLVVLCTAGAWKELLVTTFDRQFASSIGVPVRIFDGALLVLLTAVIVVSIKILGVVLVAAMLILPASTAILLSDRFLHVVVISAALGATAGIGGQYLSVIFHVSPGPSVICFSFTLLAIAVAFAPRRGLLRRFLERRRLARRTARENLISSAWRVREKSAKLAPGQPIPLAAIAAERGESLDETRALGRRLRGSVWGTLREDGLLLSAEGERHAREVLRGHRLWELFLAREAGLPIDHVHEGAETVEHYLTEEARRELERFLDHPDIDPHGKRIPRGEAPEKEGER